jgi:hypothetical protein
MQAIAVLGCLRHSVAGAFFVPIALLQVVGIFHEEYITIRKSNSAANLSE